MRQLGQNRQRRTLFAATIAAVLAIAAAAGPLAAHRPIPDATHTASIPTPVPDSTRASAAAAARFFTGVFLGDARSTPDDIAGAIEDFARLTGSRPGLVKTFLRLGDDFSRRGWPGRLVREVHDQGAVNFVALDLAGGGTASGGLLAAVVAGELDDEIRATARGLAGVRGAVLVELGWEMNGDWGYAWQGAANGGDHAAAERFAQAWRRIVDLFRAEGAHNVRWVFSPNTGNPVGGAPRDESHWNWYGNYYPGDEYVDYVGVHGFNGPSVWGGPDRSFARLFDGTEMGGMLSDLEHRFHKPIIIGEFATQESGDGSKERWIESAYRQLLDNPAVVGAVWFHMDKEADWRVDSSPGALRAYRHAVTAPRVRGPF
ncbi:MAG: glycosyl hydrolase, partial [Gemmatimonadota bacterium]